MKNGQFKVTFADGSVFRGDFEDDQIRGEGVYTWADGRSYEGQWK